MKLKKVLIGLLVLGLFALVGCSSSAPVMSGQANDQGKKIINSSILDINGSDYALSGKVNYSKLDRVGQLEAGSAFTGSVFQGYVKVDRTIDGDPVTHKYGVFSLFDNDFVLEATFDEVYIDNDYITNGYIRVKNGSKLGVYSLSKKLIVPIEYDVIARTNVKYIVASKTILVGDVTKYEYTIFDNLGSISYSPITNSSGTIPNITINELYFENYAAAETSPLDYSGYIIERWATNVGVTKYFKLEAGARTEYSYGHFANDQFENINLSQWSPRWKSAKYFYEITSNLNNTTDYIFYDSYSVSRKEISRFTYDINSMSMMEFEDKIVYQVIKEVADDAKNYTFYDGSSKYKLYSYVFNIADGKVKTLDLDYVIGGVKIALLDDKLKSSYIYSFVFRINDKVISETSEHWLINNSGKLIQKFAEASPISAAKVKDNRYIVSGKLIDGSLNVISDFANSSIISVTPNVIVLGHSDSVGVIDLEGNIVHEFKYKQIGKFHNGFARATLHDDSFVWLAETASTTRAYSTTLSYAPVESYGYAYEQVTQEEIVYYKIYAYGEAIVGSIANVTNVTVTKKGDKCLLKVITTSTNTEYYVLS